MLRSSADSLKQQGICVNYFREFVNYSRLQQSLELNYWQYYSNSLFTENVSAAKVGSDGGTTAGLGSVIAETAGANGMVDVGLLKELLEQTLMKRTGM